MYTTEEERKVYYNQLKQRKIVMQSRLRDDIRKRNMWTAICILAFVIGFILTKLYEAANGWSLDANTMAFGFRLIILPMLIGCLMTIPISYDKDAKDLQSRGVRLPLDMH